MGPKYAMERVVAARDLDGLLEADAFARSLVASLREFDAYICPLSVALIAKHGQLTEGEDGDSVLVVSMHPAERPPKKEQRKR